MKRMSCLALVAVLSVLVVAPGCRSKQDKAKRDAAAASGTKTRTTADRMEAFYPRVLGNFYRTDVTRHDETGQNASVSYVHSRDTGEPLIVFTAYVYPGGEGAGALQDAVDAATKDVKSERRGVKVLGTTPASTQQAGQTYAGRKITFQYTDKLGGQNAKAQPLMSEVYVFKKGDKIVKHRATYPAAAAGEAQQRLAGFLSAFPWPSGI